MMLPCYIAIQEPMGNARGVSGRIRGLRREYLGGHGE